MHRIQFIHQPHPDGARSLRAFLASCAFHGLAIGLLLGLTFLYRSHLPPLKSGSAPGAPSITLQAMVIVSPPPPSPSPAPSPVKPEAVTISIPPPPAPEHLPKLPEEGIPVLALAPSKPTPIQPIPAKAQAVIHPVISHPTTAAALSSYAPGRNLLPHPPYPIEARNLDETGTVIMNVQFDAEGNVAQAEVARSSGVPLLDIETRAFIRAHWHSAEYAGQTISQPVQYSLGNL